MEKIKPHKIRDTISYLLVFLAGLWLGNITKSDKTVNANDAKTVNSLVRIIGKKDSSINIRNQIIADIKKEKQDDKRKLDSLVDVSSQKPEIDSSLYMKGLIEGKKVAKKDLLAFMIIQHRNLPENKKDSFLLSDKAKRNKMLPDWGVSFDHLYDLLSDWEFLDSMHQIFASAKVLPIYIADTLGATSEKKQPHLSIIPLSDDEYLIYRGKNEETAGYYQMYSNMIVLRDNDLDTAVSKYSFWNASTLLHELCHYYLTQKKYKGNEHAWIKKKLYELHDRLEQLYPGESPEEAIASFEERKVENDLNSQTFTTCVVKVFFVDKKTDIEYT